ncbi:hypothetical protein [Paraburkholderia tropica]|uniref:hypothetical protein n=1 Tax=Paraburkholderia tropica TaxID=92647 RepID=UPI002AB673CC|nr:hypothetical protein [Paraburkholderia tropica]
MTRLLKDLLAIVGIGALPYFRHRKSQDSEFKLVLKTVLSVCTDAAIDPLARETVAQNVCYVFRDRAESLRA